MLANVCEKYKGAKVLVATSAGVDSMALLHLLHSTGAHVGACYIDHRQREIENAKEILMLRQFCDEREISFSVYRLSDTELSDAQSDAQNVFRKARYEKLFEHAIQYNYNFLATAHHLDDQLETQFMRFMKGYDILSLAGISAAYTKDTVQITRPLLGVRKVELIDYCRENNVDYLEDSSNRMNDYLRNRVRNVIFPMLKEENPELKRSLKNQFETMNALSTFFQKDMMKSLVIDDNLSDEYGIVTFQREVFQKYLESLDSSLQQFAVRILLKKILGLKKRISEHMLSDLVALFMKKDKFDYTLSEALYLSCAYGKLFIMDKKEKKRVNQKLVMGEMVINGMHIKTSLENNISVNDSNTYLVPLEKFNDGLYVVSSEPNFYLPLKNGRKKLNRLYIDEKMIQPVRAKALVLKEESSDEVLIDFMTNRTNKKREMQENNQECILIEWHFENECE